MNYKLLTSAEQHQIILERLRVAEIDHARNAIELRLAEHFGTDGAEIATMHERQRRLEEIAETLLEWSRDREPIPSNGRSELVTP